MPRLKRFTSTECISGGISGIERYKRAVQNDFGGSVIRGLVVIFAGVVLVSAVAAQTSTAPAPVAPADKPALSAKEIQAQEYRRKQDDQLHNDWAFLKKYQAANVALPAPAADERRVVFMGDSITEGWMNHGTGASATTPGFFPGKPYIDRGISGQTTPQMLVRFRPDVIDLEPSVVVILAGINDIAGNTGEMTLAQTEENLASMADLANAHGIKVVMCSILPAFAFPWHPGLEPAPKVIEVNRWMKDYAASHGYVYVDYYAAMADARGGLPANLAYDGVHPTPEGYAIMNTLVEAGIAKALAGS
jgi:lysophospholipase L1-like esterase